MVEVKDPILERNRLDPEDATQALVQVQHLLQKQRLVEAVTHRAEEGHERADLVESLVHRGHLKAVGDVLDTLHPADVAFILDALPPDDRATVWELVRAENDGEVLLEVSESTREQLIASMNRAELVAAAETLEADEIADLAPDLPSDVITQVEQSLSVQEREQLRAAMSYHEDSVGARMDFEQVMVRDDVTLEVVLRYLRRFDQLPDQTDQVFVVDREEYLKGSLPFGELLINDPDRSVAQVMQTEILTLKASDDLTDAAQAFERYDLVSAPVVDDSGKLIGRLTVNEVVDVIREENQEQQLARVGLREEEDIFAPLGDAIKNRAPWLLINLCTASMAAFVVSRFEGTVEKIVILSALMGIVAGIGGNSGNQVMTVLIRALALGQVNAGNLWRLVRKEVLTALLIGFGGGMIAGLFAYLLSGKLALWAVMAVAMTLNILVGAAVGILVPVIRDRMGKDPALGSSVLLTFATDSMGFFIFLGLATAFLL